ncbi:L,D-transpeptidase family protein [Stappia sp. F7233]|uniref:L,D-transpeptidase family protein n=1 Tax=Stappia albiluteola TaxID=2758565 RepID=A0A839ALE5_9HYPH|nr:L,D-transpeptidase family protein [Stappia albiluteola]MBA5779269.1 L,D-transpeptidase family protein [Stappia albiluteola]
MGREVRRKGGKDRPVHHFAFAVLTIAIAGGFLTNTALASGASRLQPVTLERPEAAEANNDPLQLVVSLKEQRLDVYRGTELIDSTRVSSGKPGYGTPTGVFSILEKRRKHFSNLYDDAPMPYMQRITWSGVALHEGRVPNYPASHGCVRLPRGFAQKLFGMTERGAHVVITRDETRPEPILHTSLLQPRPQEAAVAVLDARTIAGDPALRGAIDADVGPAAVLPKKVTAKRSEAPLRMLVTRLSEGERIREMQLLLARLGYEPGPADGVFGRKTRAALETFQEGADLPVTGVASNTVLKRLYAEAGREGPYTGRVYVRQNFREIYAGPVGLKDPEAPLGTFIFTALSFGPVDREVEWMGLAAEERGEASAEAVLQRIDWPDSVRAELEERLTPGSSIIVTDRTFRLHSGLGTDFIVTTR